MQSEIEREYVTQAEAAKLLGISKATLHRWIKRGVLPAYSIGPRRVRIKRADVARVIKPMSLSDTQVTAANWGRKMTEQEVQQLRKALRMADELRASILRRRNGVPMPSSADLIREEREERTEHLLDILDDARR